MYCSDEDRFGDVRPPLMRCGLPIDIDRWCRVDCCCDCIGVGADVEPHPVVGVTDTGVVVILGGEELAELGSFAAAGGGRIGKEADTDS